MRLKVNKLALNAGWEHDILAIELQALVDLEFDMDLTGFSLSEIDFVIEKLWRYYTGIPIHSCSRGE